MVSRWQEARSREGAARRQRKRPRRPTHPLRAGLLSRRAGRPPLRRQVRLPRLPAPRSRLGEAAHPLRAARRHRRRGARGQSSRARGRGCARAAFREAPRNRPQVRCSARGRAPSQRRAARQSGRTRRAENAEMRRDAPGSRRDSRRGWHRETPPRLASPPPALGSRPPPLRSWLQAIQAKAEQARKEGLLPPSAVRDIPDYDNDPFDPARQLRGFGRRHRTAHRPNPSGAARSLESSSTC